MMRLSKTLGSLFIAAVATVAITAATESAQAGDESLVNVNCAGGAVSVKAAHPWHVNKAAPWKWDKGDKVSLEEGEAKFKGAKCEGTVKAFVCNGDQCKGPIQVTVK